MKPLPFLILLGTAAAVAAQPKTDVVLVPKDSTATAIANFKTLQAEVKAGSGVIVDAPATQRDFSILTSGDARLVNIRAATMASELEALPLSKDRIKAVEAEIQSLMLADPKSDPSFLSALQEDYTAARTPYFDVGTMARVNAVGSPVITSGTNGLFGVNASIATNFFRARARGLAVRASELQLLPAKGRNDPVAAKFYRQYEATLATYKAAIKDPNTTTIEALKADARLTRTEFIGLWPQLRNDPERRSQAVRHLDGLLEQSALKAVYEIPSNFGPESYEKIHAQSRRTVPLIRSNQRFCTGYMLSHEWLMTAGHCLKAGDIQTMSVALQPIGGGTPLNAPIDDQWPRSGTGSEDTDDIDYVFLHIRPAAGVATDWKTAWDKISAAAPACLARQMPNYKQPVVVIAHRPASPLLVYDHAYVWFPFQAPPKMFQEMSAMTGAKLQRLAEAWFTSPAKQQSFFDQFMKEFEDSYKPAPGDMREYRAEHEGIGERPYFGMDTDTFQGNSGAPVFLRDEVCIAGVFSGGALDGAKIQEATWKEHEFAVPLSQIVKHVRGLDPASDGATDAEKAARQTLLALLPQ